MYFVCVFVCPTWDLVFLRAVGLFISKGIRLHYHIWLARWHAGEGGINHQEQQIAGWMEEGASISSGGSWHTVMLKKGLTIRRGGAGGPPGISGGVGVKATRRDAAVMERRVGRWVPLITNECQRRWWRSLRRRSEAEGGGRDAGSFWDALVLVPVMLLIMSSI